MRLLVADSPLYALKRRGARPVGLRGGVVPAPYCAYTDDSILFDLQIA